MGPKLILLPLLGLTPPTEGSPGTKRCRKIAENYNRLSRVHERCRRQTDGRAIAYSEREREFTFANKTGFSFSYLQKPPLQYRKYQSSISKRYETIS